MKMMKLWMLVAVAAIASACSKESAGIESPTTTKTVTFIANEVGGRTAFGTPDGNTYPVLWQEGDAVKMNANLECKDSGTGRVILLDGDTSPTVTPINGGKAATFTISQPTAADAYTYYAVSPAAAWQHANDKGATPNLFRLQVAVNQSPSADSCDPAAQVLYANSETTTDIEAPVALNFKHVAAYGCMTLKNAPADIHTVTLSAASNISYRFWYNIDTEEITFSNTDISNATSSGAKTIVITPTSNDVWFAMIPTDLSGQPLKIVIETTNGDKYIKTITFANGEGNFQAGRIAKFSVNFADVEKEEGIKPFQLYEIYKENGVAQGVVFWVSDDGQTAKIISLDRCEASVWSNDLTSIGVTANPKVDAIDDCSANMSTVVAWLKEHADVEMPIVAFCQAKGEGWYWPAYYELLQLAAAYNGVATHNDIKNAYGSNVVAPSDDEATAQAAFEAKLKEAAPNADPLNANITYPVGTAKGSGDRYWACRERDNDETFYVQYGYHVANYAKKTNKWFGRAVKVVTK